MRDASCFTVAAMTLADRVVDGVMWTVTGIAVVVLLGATWLTKQCMDADDWERKRKSGSGDAMEQVEARAAARRLKRQQAMNERLEHGWLTTQIRPASKEQADRIREELRRRPPAS